MTQGLEVASFSRHNIEAVVRKPLTVFRTKDSVHSNPAKKARDGVRNAVAAATPGDLLLRRTLEEMFVALRSRFVATAYSILKNQEDAEEAVQEAFLSAHCHLRNFEGRSALKTWLTRIVLNSALMMRRKRKPVSNMSLSESDAANEEDWTESIADSHPNPEKLHAERETFRFIDGILGKMKPALRQAFTMTYYDELSREEASAVLRVSVGTFKARLFRARRLVLDKTERTLRASQRKLPASTYESWKRKGLQGFRAPGL